MVHRPFRSLSGEAPGEIHPAGRMYRKRHGALRLACGPGKGMESVVRGWKPRNDHARGLGPTGSREGGRSESRVPYMTDRLGSGGQGAFTLVEVLTVLAVVSVLAALLLPALSSANQRAHAVACLNNLRQWGLATQLYAADHEDFLPPDGAPNPTDSSTNFGWYIQLPRVLGLPRYHDMPWRTNAAIEPGRSVWICPANPRRSNGRNLFHYCLNEHVNGTGDANQPVRLGSIPEPGRTVWLFDSKNLPAVGFWNYVHTNLHLGGAQFTFLDGHVRRLPLRTYWDTAANQPRRESPDLRWIP